jgi:hypothetical protein
MSAQVLPDQARDRLAKLLGMLGSDHAAEVATFGAAADRLVREHNLTWSDILQPQKVVVVEEDRWRPPPSSDAWRGTVSMCLRCPRLLSDWETGFLNNLLHYSSLSPKQAACLQTISTKLFGADA